MNEVEYQRKMLELVHGPGVTEAEAIRKMAEREVFLQSPAEQAWRRNLKVGDFVYIESDAGFGISTHIHKVTKITSTRIHTLGIWWLVNFYGKEATGTIKWEFDILTGRFSRKGANPSYAITSRPAEHREMGLQKQEYKKRLLAVCKKSIFHGRYPLTEQDLERSWQEYRHSEMLIGFRQP